MTIKDLISCLEKFDETKEIFVYEQNEQDKLKIEDIGEDSETQCPVLYLNYSEK